MLLMMRNISNYINIIDIFLCSLAPLKILKKSLKIILDNLKVKNKYRKIHKCKIHNNKEEQEEEL